MKIVFTSYGTKWDSEIDPRFGRASYLLVYDTEKDQLTDIDNTAIEEEAHGAGTKTSALVSEINPDVIITGNGPGGNAAMVLAETQVAIFTGAENMTIKEAYDAWKQHRLNEFVMDKN
jgi:predicted Fe-Mo cluster-binding NifX family protein